MLEQLNQQSISGNWPAAAPGVIPGEMGYRQPPVKVLLLMANALDSQSLVALMAERRGIEVVEFTSDVDLAAQRCRLLEPQVLLVDPRWDGQRVERMVELVHDGFAEHLIVLDDRVHEGRLARLLAVRAVSYLTRPAGIDALCAAIVKVAGGGERVFDPAIERRIVRTARGLRLVRAPGRPSIAALTARELEVMQRLAQGSSVRDCAAEMRLAESTIDNHKARLMKKLQIHKAAELTHMAIREGVISI